MSFLAPSSELALWVGVEPTVSRVGDDILDQISLSGFHDRLDDIDRLATLGAQAVRFPLLWERTAPDGLACADWSWGDTRLARLSERGLAPILGLVHHGSGPPSTHLLDPQFARGLADYARAVAERYPQVSAYTPVNEPLTTARFAALYGYWYPHARDEGSFWKALMHQLQATVLAIREIRQVNPEARLIQTEDLGRTFSTPALQAQADFENERRWLSFDLLLGQVDRNHALWAYLRWCGATERELDWFIEHPCPPDVLGLNTYVTSERFLDERLERYPNDCRGGNHSASYADVEAVRVRGAPLGTTATRLREAGTRYSLPLAITETHLDCTREEQLRWLLESWNGAQEVRGEGVNVCAVTAWAAFGAYEWNSLLTRREGHYESGLWDVRAPEPRPTALVQLARELARGQLPSHPVLAGPGWWRRKGRLLYLPEGEVEMGAAAGPPMLIIGATGALGQAFRCACEERGLPYVSYDHNMSDLADIQAILERWRPWAVINTAVDFQVNDEEFEVWQAPGNALEPQLLAQECAARQIPLVAVSSDLVLGGQRERPYLESDSLRPSSVYGHRQLAAEEAIMAAHPDALVVRTGPLFGPWDEHNFAQQVRRKLRAGRRIRVANDQTISPTYLPDLTRVTLDLLVDGDAGVWHLANVGAVTRAGWAAQVAALNGLNATLIDAVPAAEVGLSVARARYSVLGSERAWIMPEFGEALRHWSEVTRQNMPTPELS
ncbi:family 1 glycosylhydrolase [Deinococcus humi]|uniref:dTDP-4-dehydrorhamnose reductase n=1 Tax=Deinococcus humi TaxID=662880 RepID=A0A7W8JTL5_9DEIO|nr:family 1 glycosylhydrolase [Deinococcus humi]MBB5362990.1 dTDP-4-dehydrorhamnose reductase [Deinococcus humi]GGO25265.1 hypothetical protein GCM10008949_14930 [Deinococcus humi]